MIDWLGRSCLVRFIMEISEFHAMARFGLGASPQDAKAVRGNPRGWLLDQLKSPQNPAAIQTILQNAEGMKATEDLVAARKSKQKGPNEQKKDAQKEMRSSYIDECRMRFEAQLQSSQPLIERLVMFWGNHFTVSIAKPVVAGMVNHFEATAIRPHVTGKFSDMLLASSRHPAMLIYLDNAKSSGPHSVFGSRREKSYNENLAREIMELHSLGVDGGYTQADVIGLALIITGWSVGADSAGQLAFAFNKRMHEPGSKTLLGKTYAEAGEEEGRAALLALAHHPATAKHIATKLARHFVSDDPPAAVVTRLADVFMKTGGDLRAVTESLIQSEEAWTSTLNKFKTPYDYAVSAMRMLEIKKAPQKTAAMMSEMNYRIFAAPSPAGYADDSATWSSSGNIIKRIEWARQLAEKISINDNPSKLAEAMLGPVMREETRKVIAGAPSPQDGMAFLLSSPEFMRR